MPTTRKLAELQELIEFGYGDVHQLLADWHDSRTVTLIFHNDAMYVWKVRAVLGDSDRWSINPVREGSYAPC